MVNLLIGGTGFIGSALSQRLIANNERVVAVGSSVHKRLPGVKYWLGDLNAEELPADLVAKARHVYFMVGQSALGFNAVAERRMLTRLLGQFKESLAHVFLFSTSLVYGNTDRPAREMDALNPIDPYSRYKKAAEMVAAKIIPASRLTILRLANVYGTPMNRGIIGLLAEQASLPNPEITLNGSGQQRRDYMFVDDLVAAIIAIRNSKITGPVNVGTGKSHSLLEVVETFNKVAPRPIRYILSGKEKKEARNALLSSTLLKRKAGFNAFRSLEDGIRITLERY